MTHQDAEKRSNGCFAKPFRMKRMGSKIGQHATSCSAAKETKQDTSPAAVVNRHPDANAAAEDNRKPSSKWSFSMKKLLSSLTFNESEMELLKVKRQEIEAMRNFGVSRETFLIRQANEAGRYHQDDWQALHDILAFDNKQGHQANASLTLQGKRRDRRGWWHLKLRVSPEDNPTEEAGLPSTLALSIWYCGVDQCSKQVQGAASCGCCAVELACWLLTHPHRVPSTVEEMSCILQYGAAEWRNMCAQEHLAAMFADGHFDMETVLAYLQAQGPGASEDPVGMPAWQQRHRLRLCRERSMVGFFHLPGVCPQLDGLMEGSLTDRDLWKAMAKQGPACYIIAWNDHFLCVRVEGAEQGGAIYLMDSLGRRLHALCSSAFIVRFETDAPAGEASPERRTEAGTVGRSDKGEALPLVDKEGTPVQDRKSSSNHTKYVTRHSSSSSLGGCVPTTSSCSSYDGTPPVELPRIESAMDKFAAFFRSLYAGSVLHRLQAQVPNMRNMDEQLPSILQRLQIDVYYMTMGD